MPNTLLGALLHSVPFDPMVDRNLNRISPTPFLRRAWWLNSTFAACASTQAAILELRGINYRADVLVNGVVVASNTSIVGPFRRFVLDVTALQESTNSLAIRLVPPFDNTFPPNSNTTDLSITFVDWSPDPPDRSMGILEPTTLSCVALPVSFLSIVPNTTVGESEFNVSLSVSFKQLARCLPVNASLTVVLSLSDGNVINVTSAFNNTTPQKLRVLLSSTDYGSLRFTNKTYLWNPWQIGPPTMHTAAIYLNAGTVALELFRGKIAFRQVSSFIDAKGSRQFVVNRHPIQIRGGGWAPDLFLRADEQKLYNEFLMIRHMGLNAIRLEGKFMWDGFFDLADSMGLMILPGWCCCDSWQHWAYWGKEQYAVAASSLRWQLNRLARHPSVITFFYSSDQLPPARVEHMYLQVIRDSLWPNPTVSSASATPSPISGPSGVKMSGPYAWVPPAYWLSDDNKNFADLGGAWGFLTEGGPGSSPLTEMSWSKTVSAKYRWSAAGLLGEMFSYHCANPMGLFRDMRYFVPALNARYGSASTAGATLHRAQVATFEAIRAMFEGYSRKKHDGATGVIQWMMNNPWPSNMWHLFDFWQGVGGGFYGARRACSSVNVMLSYTDWSVAVVNSLFEDVWYRTTPLTITAAAIAMNGSELWAGRVTVGDSLPADAVLQLPQLTVPLATVSSAHDVVLVRLQWNSPAGTNDVNDYWLSYPMDVINWTDSNFFRTGVSRFANFSGLLQTANTSDVSIEDKVFSVREPEGTILNLTLRNVGERIAFAVSIHITSPVHPIEVTPTLCSENYLNLLPSERRQIVCEMPTLATSTGALVHISTYKGTAQGE
uniref:Exo-1,4-beta-D-glucosaminidase n=1 Tax=Neobodo designis TaxID=312471 RepID=A0A7S1PV44_NEODS